MARRLKEREDREREEQERLQEEKENLALGEKQEERRQAQAEPKLPPGVLTPLLARHRDLDDQLRARLAELEEK